MKNPKNGSALGKQETQTFRNRQNREDNTGMEYFQPETSWEDMERLLQEHEQGKGANAGKKLHLSSACAMQQLQRIIRKVKSVKRLFVKNSTGAEASL